jgi:2-polyprenyl-3-methyl-5-hydroxy-6-metoxy-1,4-benzoquinol methylase
VMEESGSISTQGSFRDPAGSVFMLDGRVFRFIHKPYGLSVRQFIDSNFFHELCATGVVPNTQVLDAYPPCLRGLIERNSPDCVLEHQPIPFPTYPHEWTPGMLYHAGQLTLDLAERAHACGWVLKDATPWNLPYADGRPVFCDILSFERWEKGGIWHPYAQFQRCFVLPLYAHLHHAWPVHATFVEARDGTEPAVLEPVIRGWRRWAPFELQTIVLPTKLAHLRISNQKSNAIKTESHESVSNEELANFVIKRSFLRLRKQLEAVRPKVARTSRWGNYEAEIDHYQGNEISQKEEFVRAALSRLKGKGRVLDLGANAGHYSLIAANQGLSVIAADIDVSALEKLYQRSLASKVLITPVVLNIARPTPAVGWANLEVKSFLDRARGQFQMIMILALLHHLIVTERIPLEYVIKLLFDLETPYILIEWVSPDDSRFREISKTHGDLYAAFTIESFRQAMNRYFKVIECLPLQGGTRILHYCERRK